MIFCQGLEILRLKPFPLRDLFILFHCILPFSTVMERFDFSPLMTLWTCRFLSLHLKDFHPQIPGAISFSLISYLCNTVFFPTKSLNSVQLQIKEAMYISFLYLSSTSINVLQKCSHFFPCSLGELLTFTFYI